MRYLILLLLAGCTQTEYVTVTKEVKVAVPVPCVESVLPPPIYATKDLEAGSSDADVVLALGAEIMQREAVESYLRGELMSCVGVIDQPSLF